MRQVSKEEFWDTHVESQDAKKEDIQEERSPTQGRLAKKRGREKGIVFRLRKI